MANIAVRATSTATSNSTATLSVTAPTGTVAGDLVIVSAARNAINSSSFIVDNNGSTGFTRDYAVWDGTNGNSLCIFSRRIIAGDPSSYSFTLSGDTAPTNFSLIAFTFSNPHPSTIYDVAPSSGTYTHVSGTSASSINITSTVAGCIHLLPVESEGGNNDNNPAGYNGTPSIGELQLGQRICYKTIATATAVGAQTLTFNASAAGNIQSILIKNGGGTAFTLAVASGSYGLTGTDITMRTGAFTYLRYRK